MCMMASAIATGRKAETKPAPLFDAAAVDGMIRHWQQKADAAPDLTCRLVAEAHVSGLQLARVIHGLPLLELETDPARLGG